VAADGHPPAQHGRGAGGRRQRVHLHHAKGKLRSLQVGIGRSRKGINDYLFDKKKGKLFSHKLYFPSGS
jgi:hypothetical protein